MSPLNKIIATNLGILLLVALVLRLANRGEESAFSFTSSMAFAIAAQVLGNLSRTFDTADPAKRRAYWLSLLLVLLIGFGVCAGGSLTY